MRTFGRPQGLLGRIGGTIMARTNHKCAAWVVELLEVQPNHDVVEVGFGPGVGIELLTRMASAGRVAGVDNSVEMVEQAKARNAEGIKNGRVDLRHGSVADLPFEDNMFDRALAINSMQVWPDAAAGLREIQRVLKASGRVALGFTPYSGQPKSGLTETIVAAGFTNVRMAEKDQDFCVLATRP